MRRGAAVIVGAVLVAGTVAGALLAASWLGADLGDQSVPPTPAPPPEAPAPDVRPGREHVDTSSARGPVVDGDSPPTVRSWLTALCRDGEPLTKADGSDVEWWAFPLDEVMAALLDAIARDDIEWSASRAFDEIRSIGYLAAPWAEDVARYLRDDTHAESARVTLAAMGPDAMPVVRTYLDDEDPRIRERALLVFAEADYRRREVVELAVAALDDADDDVRAAAVEVLAAHTEAPELSVPVLTSLVEDAAASGRLDVLHALAMYGPDAAPALPALVRLLADSRSRGKRVAFDVLRQVGPAAEPAVPTLVTLFLEERGVFGEHVPSLIAEISPDAYLALLADDRESVRAAFAARAELVVKADPSRTEDVLAALSVLESDAAATVRERAATGRRAIQTRAEVRRVRLQGLEERLTRSAGLGVRDRVRALVSIRRAGTDARRFAATVREFLHDTDDRVRLHAALAVWTIDPPATDVEPTLRLFRDDPSLRAELYQGLTARPPPGWAEYAVGLLREEDDPSPVLGPAYALVEAMGEAALDPLIRLAETETRDQRLAWVAVLLYGIGEPAVPTLRELAGRPGLLPPIRAEILRLAETAR